MHEITINLPFPIGEGGWGDRGQESKLKAGLASDKKDTPPPGTTAARSAGDQPGKPSPAPERQGKPPKRSVPPHFFTFSPCQRRADVIQYVIDGNRLIK